MTAPVAPVAARPAADLAAVMAGIGRAARAAMPALARAPGAQRDKALRQAAAAIRQGQNAILDANASDIEAARAKGATPAFVDRLALGAKGVEAMAQGLEAVADLPDPLGQVAGEWTRPNGLVIQRVRVPLGVIGIVYESRPNVTADAGGLCLKAGNPCILRGGSESFHTARAIGEALGAGLDAAGLPRAAIQLVPTTDRDAVGHMLAMAEHIDVIVPRGGKSLVARVQAEARMPVFAHLEGLCHVYVDGAAELGMARRVTLNSKMRRVSVCGAAETLLVDKRAAPTHLKPILDDLIAAGCEVRGDAAVQAADPRVRPAREEDWRTEYLEPIISARVVDGVGEAIHHIETYGSRHTDAIVTEDAAAAERFLAELDSAIVLWNASTQFADGGEFGMGAEIGIATGRIHARGPVGAEQLTTMKYVVRGRGQTRP
jgi:glutamate-5-semialdehyde dehydrogenase